MARTWFRRPTEPVGPGHTTSNVEGLVACIVFAVVVTVAFTAVLYGTARLGWDHATASAAAGATSLAVVVGFLWLVPHAPD